MKDLFYTHWKDNDAFIDYFFIDYGLRLYYDAVPAFKETVDKEATFSENLYVLQHSLNDAYNAEMMAQVTESTMFSKLTWKGQLNTSINGKETFYGHIISFVHG